MNKYFQNSAQICERFAGLRCIYLQLFDYKANNLGAFYKFVNKKLSNHSGIAPLKSVDGSLVTDDGDRANLLNSYFESVFTHDDGSTPSFPSRLPTTLTYQT